MAAAPGGRRSRRAGEPGTRITGVDGMTQPIRTPGRTGLSLITGGAGFVATNVAERLLASGRRVRLFDNLSRAGVEENLRWILQRFGDRVEFVRGDIRDESAVRRTVRPRLRPHVRAAGQCLSNELHLRPSPVRHRGPGLGRAFPDSNAAAPPADAVR